VLVARGLHRRPAPAAVVERYDARRTAAAVDALYADQLAHDRRSSRRAH
jgi:hypothetical protein